MAAISETAKRFHFGLNVDNLDRAVAFYKTLFGVEPVKHFPDYAKFSVDEPPLVLALHPAPHQSGGALNHVGFRLKTSEELVAVQQRLEMNGIRTQREEGVECCYALQTKFWVPDADRNLWEIYTLHEDLDHSGFGGDGHGMPPRPDVEAEPVVWQHFITARLPSRIPHADESLDEILFEGTFNTPRTTDERRQIFAEAFRTLKPGGKLRVHGLVADKPFVGKPQLPGPAAMVQHIPLETEQHDDLLAAGFVGLEFDKLGDIHCFKVGGVELRELRLTALKPAADTGENDRFVLYRGPLREVRDEQGQTFPCGQRVRVDRTTWNRLRQPPYTEFFTCFPCQQAEEK